MRFKFVCTKIVKKIVRSEAVKFFGLHPVTSKRVMIFSSIFHSKFYVKKLLKLKQRHKITNINLPIHSRLSITCKQNAAHDSIHKNALK